MKKEYDTFWAAANGKALRAQGSISFPCKGLLGWDLSNNSNMFAA